MSKKVLCIYHGNCVDGFGAAWVVRRNYPNADFYSGVYQQSPPDVSQYDLVILVDFSYSRDVIVQMAEQVDGNILIIDHHKSAIAQLVDLPDNVETVFDMDNSGAMLAWNWFYPHDEPPMLLKFIEDRDLWKFSLTETKDVIAGLFSHSYSFETYDWFSNDSNLFALALDGKAILRKQQKDIEEFLPFMTLEREIAGYLVPVVNLPYTFASDVGHIIGKGKAFAATYYDTENGRVYSLRSDENGLDVSEIARQFGGGGHKHAAGFTVPHGHELA